MTKQEFIQKAALTILDNQACEGVSPTAIAVFTRELADEVWKQFEEEKQPEEPKEQTEYLYNEYIETLEEKIEMLEYDKLERLRKKNHPWKYKKSGYSARFASVCKGEEIHTVGQLLNMGREYFSQLRHVGPKLLELIDQALNELYNIKTW